MRARVLQSSPGGPQVSAQHTLRASQDNCTAEGLSDLPPTLPAQRKSQTAATPVSCSHDLGHPKELQLPPVEQSDPQG